MWLIIHCWPLYFKSAFANIVFVETRSHFVINNEINACIFFKDFYSFIFFFLSFFFMWHLPGHAFKSTTSEETPLRPPPCASMLPQTTVVTSRSRQILDKQIFPHGSRFQQRTSAVLTLAQSRHCHC